MNCVFKKRFLSLLLLIPLVFLSSGCSSSTASPTESQEPVELMVSAASSLSTVSEKLTEAYKTIAPNVTLKFNLDSSGTLQTQIEAGAPADIFISAAPKQMDALEAKDLIVKTSRKNLLTNKVVLIVPKGSSLDIKSFTDVATDKVSTVALGDSSVPAGQYAQQIFTNLKIWDAVKAKANLAPNVRTVLSWVEAGNVNCGVVYATDAASSKDVTVICEAPSDSYSQAVYPVAVVANTSHSKEAQAFVDFLSSDKATAIFKDAGFSIYK